jgi:hypothetical protein
MLEPKRCLLPSCMVRAKRLGACLSSSLGSSQGELTTVVRSALYVRSDCAAIHLAVVCWITEIKRAVVIPNIIRPLAA